MVMARRRHNSRAWGTLRPAGDRILRGVLDGAPNVERMSLRWRIGLVFVAAAAVVGGMMPHGTLAGAERTTTQVLQAVEPLPWEPVHCVDATCGKGNTAPSAPTPTVALAAVLGALVAATVAAGAVRRLRARVAALPAGARDPLFHPPQFS